MLKVIVREKVDTMGFFSGCLICTFFGGQIYKCDCCSTELHINVCAQCAKLKNAEIYHVILHYVNIYWDTNICAMVSIGLVNVQTPM